MKTQADQHAATELFLYIQNTGELYDRRTTAIIGNLGAKIAKQAYDADKALTLWGYLADEGAKIHTKEHGGGFGFDKATRQETARQLQEYYQGHVEDDAAERIGPETVRVAAYDYGRDSNGNPTAHYSVDSGQVTGRRVQTGYDSHHYKNGAYHALKKAGFKPEWYDLDAATLEGGRSDGETRAYWRRQPIKA